MKKSRKKGKDALDEALLKVAVGYSVEEVTEEYAVVDGEMKLLKRKETKKDVPPDLKAIQTLLSDVENGGSLSEKSEEELEKERLRLLAELKTQAEKDLESDGAGTSSNQKSDGEVGGKGASRTGKRATGSGKKKTAKKVVKKVVKKKNNAKA